MMVSAKTRALGVHNLGKDKAYKGSKTIAKDLYHVQMVYDVCSVPAA